MRWCMRANIAGSPCCTQCLGWAWASPTLAGLHCGSSVNWVWCLHFSRFVGMATAQCITGKMSTALCPTWRTDWRFWVEFCTNLTLRAKAKSCLVVALFTLPFSRLATCTAYIRDCCLDTETWKLCSVVSFYLLFVSIPFDNSVVSVYWASPPPSDKQTCRTCCDMYYMTNT